MAKTGVADGHCAAVTSGTDPDNECASDGTACGHTGLCDHNGGNGSGACAYAANGTTCPGTSTCSGNGATSTTTGSCNGAGTCGQSGPTTGTCGGYACSSAATCMTTCSGATSCVAGYSCTAGSCVASTFVSGPCIAALPSSYSTVVAFALGSDHKVHEQSNGGTGWSSWAALSSLDASAIDVHSDLDCSSDGGGTLHIVATSSNPPGAVIHTFGSGTSFNPFTREFPAQTFATPGAAIAFLPFNYGYVLGAFGPAFEDVSSGGTATTLTPITTLGSPLATAVDVAYVGGSFAQRLLAAFDNSGKLSVYVNYLPGSAPPYWATVVQLQPPSGTVFNFSPSICGDAGLTATQRIHLVAVADGELWDTYSDSSYSTWERIGTQAASAPDCALMGDQTVHVVTLNNAGHVLDIYGSPGSWTTTDLGTF